MRNPTARAHHDRHPLSLEEDPLPPTHAVRSIAAAHHYCECGRKALSRAVHDARWVYRPDHDLCDRCYRLQRAQGPAGFGARVGPAAHRPEMSRVMDAVAVQLAAVEAANEDLESVQLTSSWDGWVVSEIARALDIDLTRRS